MGRPNSIAILPLPTLLPHQSPMPRLLSRRAITRRLAARLFAEPLPADTDLFWVKYLNREARTVVLVRPDGAGQESIEIADPVLFDSLLTAFSNCNEQHPVRHLRKNKVAVFDLDEMEVTFDARHIEQGGA